MASFTMETLSTETRGMMVVRGDNDDTYGMSYTTEQRERNVNKYSTRVGKYVKTLRTYVYMYVIQRTC